MGSKQEEFEKDFKGCEDRGSLYVATSIVEDHQPFSLNFIGEKIEYYLSVAINAKGGDCCKLVVGVVIDVN